MCEIFFFFVISEILVSSRSTQQQFLVILQEVNHSLKLSFLRPLTMKVIFLGYAQSLSKTNKISWIVLLLINGVLYIYMASQFHYSPTKWPYSSIALL